ncbi:MAG: phosphonate utilization associated transcriptional regulator [Betaproteobacteria bacterium]|nr:phosphonate utilization associated transcriptional regulator [Burkholderiales bacterium]NJD87847.1 phosphonate utilization associated transcriptional regulator [Betaproteobacteria bacterium]PWB67147.1 MAG: phosphonate utilization associated transcriptional regulator [Betaproteobacteria bacterium]
MTTAAARNGPSSAIELLRSQSLTSLVQQELERRILAGNILPGDKLNENEVATELNVSRGPVREAFRALEQAGLVRTEKNRGVFVRQVSLEEADEIYEVRAGLDELIGRLAAERATDGQIDELRGLVERMKDAARARDVDAYYPLNIQFHDRLAQIAGNGTLLAAYRRLINELHLYRRRTLALGHDAFPKSTSQHAEIVEAVASRNGTLAGELLYQHAVKSRSRLHEALEQVDIQPPPALVRETPTP